MSTRPEENILTAPNTQDLINRAAAALSKRVPRVSQAHFGILCGVSTLLSAFLVFQIQPVVSKTLLPWFGGGQSVWTTCLVFFQVALLAGYAYAHLLVRFLPTLQQAIVHISMLFLAFLFLPLAPGEGWIRSSTSNPSFVLVCLLFTNVAVPYVLLAATSPLLQSWYGTIYPGKTPYRLYALSNLGSLTALLSYPFLVEPTLGVSLQSLLWSVGFVVFAVACTCLGLALRSSAKSIDARLGSDVAIDNAKVKTWSRIKWISLSAFASMSLVATTNHISVEMAVAPLLWIAPLSLYLVTFIVGFERPGWYSPRWWGLGCAVFMLLFIMSTCATWTPLDDVLEWMHVSHSSYYNDLFYQAAICTTAMFFLCQLCHGELYRCRPATKHLTSFYLSIATGGALGGLFVAAVCPLVFSSFFETKLMIGLALALSVGLMVLDGQRHWRVGQVATGMLAGVLVMFALGLAYNEVTYAERDFTVHQVRNFYGTMTVNRISDGNESGREFVHGATEHGIQYDSPELSSEPTSYYARHSGVGVALQALNNERDNLRVGAVGLGIGTIAAYGRPGDLYHFFEINPVVRTFARSEFTYLRNSKAETKVTLGDARISMENLATNSFDVLILDAFSGDAIPAHLLTLEAFDMYERLLEENGVIAVHVTNTSLNLIPIVGAAAEHLDMEMAYIYVDQLDALDSSSSDWVLLSHDKSFLSQSSVQSHTRPFEDLASPPVIWTDERNSLLNIFK